MIIKYADSKGKVRGNHRDRETSESIRRLVGGETGKQ
jgi:hypothetical protein